MAAMRLTSWEEERLLVFTAAELARRHRTAGLALNAPEAIDPVEGRVTLAGRPLEVGPATDLPLNRRYWLR